MLEVYNKLNAGIASMIHGCEEPICSASTGVLYWGQEQEE